MKSTCIFFLSFWLLASCSKKTSGVDHYPKDATLTNHKGFPYDSSTFYYPEYIKTDTGIISTHLDSLQIESFSQCLWALDEPVLYNYYVGIDCYRFLWLPSFDSPAVMTLYKDGSKVWLTVKRLNKHPILVESSYVDVKFTVPIVTVDSTIQMNTDTIQYPETETEFEKLIKAPLMIDYNKSINLSNQDWIDFEKLLKENSFWTMQSFRTGLKIDGSDWIIEAHLKNKYWFVVKSTPRDGFKKIGEFLIGKTGLHTEIY